jgi:hypothetical protein
VHVSSSKGFVEILAALIGHGAHMDAVTVRAALHHPPFCSFAGSGTGCDMSDMSDMSCAGHGRCKWDVTRG